MISLVDYAQLEKDAFKVAEVAYFKACETSDPQHWMEAAMFAQQHRNALMKLRKQQEA